MPYLSKFIDNGFIIDIGANIGDTVYGMISKNRTKFICIEPEPNFFGYLKKNIERLDIDEKSRVMLVNAAISSHRGTISLKTSCGTAHKDDSGEHSSATMTLDEVSKNFHINPEECKLVKIDTDGFDYDCILSGDNFFLETSAFLFWENDFLDSNSITFFTKAVDFIICSGYKKFYIFDNIGHIVCTTSSHDIKYFFAYYDAKKEQRNPPYYDILACKKDKIPLADEIVSKYAKDVLLQSTKL